MDGEFSLWDSWPEKNSGYKYRQSFFDEPYTPYQAPRRREVPCTDTCAAQLRSRSDGRNRGTRQTEFEFDDLNDIEDADIKDIPISWTDKGAEAIRKSWNFAIGGGAIRKSWNFAIGLTEEEVISDVSDDDLANSADNHRKPWIPSLSLTMQDKYELLHNKMLSDKHMSAAQKLLSQQFPSMGGLQDTILSQTQFRPVVGGESLQIHHTRGNHWVLSHSHGDGEVLVYDSLYEDITDDLQSQIDEIYGAAQNTRILSNVQKQKGSRDCGLFCVAFAVELCNGRDPQKATFKQRKMRKHLLHCFEDGFLKPFPKENECTKL